MVGKRIAVAVALLSATFLILALYLPDLRPQQPVPTMASGTVAIGGPFTLTDAKGQTVTEVNLKGRYSLIFFGFTHCPDICPLILQLLTQALEQAGPAGDAVQPVFISLDPERDTPEAMGAYVANFHPRFMALTGTPEQVKVVAQAYRVYYVKAPIKEDGIDTGDYTITHSGYIFLMDRNGKYVAHFDKAASASDIAARLKQLAL